MSQYIFLDESGDLGFDTSKRNSKYFVITLLFTQDKKSLEKIVKKVHRSLRKNVNKLSGGVLHSVKEKPITRKRILKLLAKEECAIMAIYLNKSHVYTHLQDEKHILYNYVTNILIDRIMRRKLLNQAFPITLIAERRETNKFLNLNFSSYLKEQVKRHHKLKIEIEICSPNKEKALQITDFVSWSLFRKYERGDETFYSLFRSKIIEESVLFP